MNKAIIFWCVALWVVTSCATPRAIPAAPVGFQSDGRPLLVIESLGGNSSRLVAPESDSVASDDKTFAKIKSVPMAPTAVVMLEDYHELQVGSEFQDRSFVWFGRLRRLGCQRIVFVRGRNVACPDGLAVLEDYR